LRSSSRLTKVRVIEDVEDFPAKLERLVFSDLGALDERHITIVEAWSNDDVSSHAPEMVDGFAANESNRQNNG
jgi:hypothetical protein